MELKSKSYILKTLFFVFGILFVCFWIFIFLSFIVFGKGFSISALGIMPVLIIPLFIMYLFVSQLDSLVFNKNGFTVYKLKFFKSKNYHWSDFDFSFDTIETGKSGISEVLYLVKDKVFVYKISNVNYKKFNEIKSLINSKIENKGKIELGFFQAFNYFTKKKNLNLP